MIFKVSPHSLEGLLLQFTCTQKLIAALAAATVVVIIVFLNVYPGHLSFLYQLKIDIQYISFCICKYEWQR